MTGLSKLYWSLLGVGIVMALGSGFGTLLFYWNENITFPIFFLALLPLCISGVVANIEESRLEH